MKALRTHYLTGLAIVLLTSTGAYAVAPTGPFIDTLSTGTNTVNNSPAAMSATFGSSGMTLTLLPSSPGAELYWSDGGGNSYDDSNNLAFSLDPTANQNVLTIDVTSLSLASGQSLEVGARFFNGTTYLSTHPLGAAAGGLNITAPGIYTLNMDTLAAANSGDSTATAWKGDFYLTGTSPNTVTISQLEAGPAPEPKAYVLMGLGLVALCTISKFRRGSARG
jgi:hypothetical protein